MNELIMSNGRLELANEEWCKKYEKLEREYKGALETVGRLVTRMDSLEKENKKWEEMQLSNVISPLSETCIESYNESCNESCCTEGPLYHWKTPPTVQHCLDVGDSRYVERHPFENSEFTEKLLQQYMGYSGIRDNGIRDNGISDNGISDNDNDSTINIDTNKNKGTRMHIDELSCEENESESVEKIKDSLLRAIDTYLERESIYLRNRTNSLTDTDLLERKRRHKIHK